MYLIIRLLVLDPPISKSSVFDIATPHPASIPSGMVGPSSQRPFLSISLVFFSEALPKTYEPPNMYVESPMEIAMPLSLILFHFPFTNLRHVKSRLPPQMTIYCLLKIFEVHYQSHMVDLGLNKPQCHDY